MPSVPSARSYLAYCDPPVVYWTTDYLKRLLIERDDIRSALVNPGASILLNRAARVGIESQYAYSNVIGNDFHLDLIEAEKAVAGLPKADRDALMAWVDGLTSQQAANFYGVRPGAIRVRQHRAARRVTEALNEGQEVEAAANA
jgi:hypothetical protein